VYSRADLPRTVALVAGLLLGTATTGAVAREFRFYDVGARSIHSSVRLVRSLADIKGFRLRAQQSQPMSVTIGALGAEAIELPYGHVLTVLAAGPVDSAENNRPPIVTTDRFAGSYKVE
jgi:TRAP-type C4-dicarboxylate transport system substrate-binding protein